MANYWGFGKPTLTDLKPAGYAGMLSQDFWSVMNIPFSLKSFEPLGCGQPPSNAQTRRERGPQGPGVSSPSLSPLLIASIKSRMVPKSRLCGVRTMR